MTSPVSFHNTVEPLLTMKYGEIDPERLSEYLANPDWLAAEKYDGRGIFIGVDCIHNEADEDGYSPVIFQRNPSGAPVKWVSGAVLADLEADLLALYNTLVNGKTPFQIRGELGNKGSQAGKLYIWDLIGPEQFQFRHLVLRAMWVAAQAAGHTFRILHFAAYFSEADDKRALYERELKAGGEGIVFAHKTSLYQPGKRVSDVLKYKFVTTADLAVLSLDGHITDVNGFRHASATCAVLGPDGGFQTVAAVHVRGGKVGGPGKELEQIEEWFRTQDGGYDLPTLEVAYLYATGGSLVQPIAKSVRLDKRTEPVELRITKACDLRVSKLFNGR